MIIPDINLLLYACDTESPFHSKAAAWWQRCLSGTESVGLPLVVVFGFVRIGTSARVYQRPMTPAEASEHVRSWLAQPAARIVEPGPDHAWQVLKLLEALGTAGNLVTDAQVAALTLEHGAILHTADSDFLRFPGLRWFNPITGTASSRLRKGESL
jgi:toxin-antitoxin system PIN domain toxin